MDIAYQVESSTSKSKIEFESTTHKIRIDSTNLTNIYFFFV